MDVSAAAAADGGEADAEERDEDLDPARSAQYWQYPWGLQCGVPVAFGGQVAFVAQANEQNPPWPPTKHTLLSQSAAVEHVAPKTRGVALRSTGRASPPPVPFWAPAPPVEAVAPAVSAVGAGAGVSTSPELEEQPSTHAKTRSIERRFM
jgi:hypothetical protein